MSFSCNNDVSQIIANVYEISLKFITVYHDM